MAEKRGRRLWLSAVVSLFWLLAMLVACQPTQEGAGPPPAGIVKHFGKGPLTLELRLDRQRLTVAERLTVELRAETDEDLAVKFIDLKELPGFAVAGASQSKPELTATGRVAVTWRYVLEPLASGAAQVPALTVEAWKKADKEAALTTVATEPVAVEVETLLAKDDSGETISDIAPPLAKPINPWLWVGAGLAGVLALALMVYLWKRRGRRIVPLPPPLPPHLLAYQALDRLLAADLLASGQVKLFFETLSDILRHYIEQRFGLRAPEQTTEEFLADLGRLGDGPLVRFGAPTLIAASHKLLLRDFLSHCDLVKFAKHTPTRAEAEERVELCRSFVRETEPVEIVETPSRGRA